MNELPKSPTNKDIATALTRIGNQLKAQRASSERIAEFRSAAKAIRKLDAPVALVLASAGRLGLMQIPAVDAAVASVIEELAYRGRIGMLDRLSGKLTAEELFRTIPGVGDKLAHQIHETLDIETLEDFEAAIHDGRLATVPGFASNRIDAIRDRLTTILDHSPRRRSRAPELLGTDAKEAPHAPVSLLLEVDAEYHAKADGEDELPRITPRKFNPDKEAWLPVMHADRDGWHLTAMFSNTALAHRMAKTRDWVVITYERNGFERQCTVLTSAAVDLAFRRVIRGREDECAAHYASVAAAPDPPPAEHPIVVEEPPSGPEELQA